jgi:hypothetical protein
MDDQRTDEDSYMRYVTTCGSATATTEALVRDNAGVGDSAGVRDSEELETTPPALRLTTCRVLARGDS